MSLNLLGILNETAKVAIVLDNNTGLCALLNGTSGIAVVLNISANTGVLIPRAWIAANVTLEVYLGSLVGGLASLLTAVGGVVFQVLTATTNILQAVNQILTCLISNLAVELQIDVRIGLRVVLNIVGGILGLLRGVLRGLLGLIGSIGVTVSKDLVGISNLLQGLGTIVGNVVGGIGGLLSGGVTNITNVLTAETGIEVLGNLILDIGVNLNLGAILDPILRDVGSLLDLLNNLSGNVNTLVSGLLKVVSNLVSFLLGRCTLEKLIYVIIQFLTSNTPEQRGECRALLNQELNSLLVIINQVGLTQTLSGLVNTVEGLLNNTLIVLGVNVSAVINLLTESEGDPLELSILISVVLQLSPVISAAVSIPTLLLVLMCLLNNIVGVGLLQGLGIVLNVTLSSVTGILTGLLGTVLNLVSVLLRGVVGLLTALLSLPVIGQLVQALVTALNNVTRGLLSLGALLNLNTLVPNVIKGLLSVLSGIGLGNSSNTTSQAVSCLNETTNENLFLNLKLNITAPLGLTLYVLLGIIV